MSDETIICPSCGREFPYPAPSHRTRAWVLTVATLVAGVCFVVYLLLDHKIIR